MSKSRSFVFTLNNYNGADIESLSNLACRYIIFGREIGESGTPHLQGYVVFSNPRSFNAVKSLMPRAHIEEAKGDAQSNYEYCSKQGDFTERGDRPFTQKQKGQANADRWKRARELAQAGDLKSIDDELYIKYQRTFERIRDQSKPKPTILEHTTRHLWIYGPSGTGKSRLARELAPDAYIKEPESKWWDHYNGEEDVIIDDFDKFQVKQGGAMKRWMDIYPFQAEVKGSQEIIRPKRIIVTSNYHPEEIWDDRVTVEAILRRVDLKFMNHTVNTYLMNPTFNKPN